MIINISWLSAKKQISAEQREMVIADLKVTCINVIHQTLIY